MDWGRQFIPLILCLVSCIQITQQNTRNKRQVSPELPRILTQDGHLVFKTGTNHNITFQSTSGGYINVDGDSLKTLAQTIKSNKEAIDQLKTTPTSIPPDVENRLANIDQRLNNLQPTGQVQQQLTSLSTRIDSLQNSVPSNVDSRLTQIEQSLANLQPTGQVQTLINGLTTRLGTIESRVTAIEGQGDGGSDNSLLDRVSVINRTLRRSRYQSRAVRRIRTKVRTLETSVQRLTTLLTADECSSNPCRNGGTCVDRYNGFTCKCPPAWQGSLCGLDVNECSVYAGTDLGCQNGASCINTQGSFSCQCTSNFHGLRCTERHDDCTGASHQELCGHGTCVNSERVQPGQPKYRCICDAGWTTSGSNPACVTDVDECQERQGACSQNPLVQCINVPGTFYCGPCPAGYSGNGYSCADINECEINNGGCSVAPRVDCVNTPGSRRCGPCPPGYQGNGVSCSWVGVCQNNNGGCHPQAQCTESPAAISGRICTCRPGYVGNGEGPSGCILQGPVTGSCASNPCRNGAACQASGNSYICICNPGYTGQQCQNNINECASNPCRNQGTCTDLVNGYNCQCSSSYTGPNCEQEQQSCGGTLRGESGVLQYPGAGVSQYPHEQNCAWRIDSTPGKIIMLRFSNFSLEPSQNCRYDFVQINDGATMGSNMLGKYCGHAIPNNGQVINSTHHQLHIWFYSDVSVAGGGFTIRWTSARPVCGGELTGQDHGSINSPGYPGNYPHNRTCIWTITVSPGNNIMFTFATVAIETHPNCSYDYLEIRDGSDESSPLLRRFCSTSSPPPLSTTGPSATVKFHTDYSMNDRGFHITYAAISAGPQCGGAFTADTGTIQSPNYPNPYNHDATCVWTITVSPADTIKFTFSSMDLESHYSCRYDFVEVRDGPDENAQLLGRYCGSYVPSALVSSTNAIYIMFRSDSSNTGSGFQATWTVACGGTFTDTTGVIQSPYFPNAYPHSKECIYLITQPMGMMITLSFTSFDVEGPNTDNQCSYDYLEIRDGGSADSSLLGTYCGAQVPQDVVTTQSMMWIKFVSDGSVANTGFQATYTGSEAICGSVLTESTGSFTSPGHPNIYPHGANCTWFIRTSPGLVIRLTFHAFSIEQNTYCRYDYVEVYDNSTIVPGSKFGRYCGGSMPPVLTSTDNVMTVYFRADSSIAHEGFSASYVSLNASTLCGSELTDSTGIITSPNYPNNYPHERECTWTITAPAGRQILLNFTDFNLESHTNCRYDYLEVRNGGFVTSPLIGKYCGTYIDQIMRSHSNRLWLQFKTDLSMSAPGFRAFYDATASGCGADLISPSGSFVSPNYPLPYSHNAECFWTITTSRGSKVQLSFVDFNLENHARCGYDYVQIKDGSSTGRELAKYCGSQTPQPVTSSSNKLWVKYRTDYSVAGRGFHAFYSSICDTRLTAARGVIESPNFPQPYPHNRNCTWVIETTLGNTINVSFSHFDIESHSSCNFDYLEIRNGENRDGTLIGKYCGRNLPPAISSSGQYLWINFKSDYSMALNGFRLEYINNGCGGSFTTATGSFTSPNYPNPYDHRRVCVWTITVATGMAIELNITDFDLETHSNCNFDVLEIHGGPDNQSPQLARICHKQTKPQLLTTTGNEMYVMFKSDISISGRGFRATYRSIAGGCGGNYSTPTGTIVSKNYPGDYPRNTDCTWLITVDPQKVIVLTFTDFDVETHRTCGYDYVAVYDGADDTNTTELMKYCGSSLPSPSIYRSSGNQLYIRMRTDGSVSARGFKAEYVTGCGGMLNAEQDDVITSPNYPNNYNRSHNCSWHITSDHADDRITLTFTHMDIESHSSCDHDSVTVYNGDDVGAPVIGSYCGDTVPAPVTSYGSSMFVTFISDFSIQRTGFRAVYTKSTSSCGGDFTAERGSFLSPGYPDSYPLDTECVWTFRISPGNRIMVSFSVFNIENHDNCNFDYVEFREGDVNGRLIGRFCGTNTPGNVTAANGLWMKFRSDADNTGVGFMGQYSTMYGGDLIGNTGQLSSPRYPSIYPHNTDYTWTITVDVGMRIRVTFVTLDMERGYNGCNYDYLRFLDGGQDDSPELARYCGFNLPGPLTSTTNQLQVQFHSDWSSTGQGFLFNWEATTDVPPSTTPTPSSTTPVPGCGGSLGATATTQVITSPGYPFGYSNNLDCVWHLRAPVGFRLWVNITDIDIETHGSCYYDKVTVYDNEVQTGRVLGTYCGRIGNLQPLVSLTNVMTIRFQSDYSYNRTGFSVDYMAVCGGLMMMTQGVIYSPNYPQHYPVNSNCTWSIIVPAGRTILIKFNSTFAIAGTSGSCQGDYVQLLNGGFLDSPPMIGGSEGRFCGNQPPAVMNTTSNRLYVTFASDNINNGPNTGFRMEFSEIQVTCGGHLTLTNDINSGVFMSPNYPSNYPHNVDCTWVITAPPLHRIQIDFMDQFNIEPHSSCNYDYVEIRDGGTVNSQLIGRYCGTTLPSTTKSTGNVMYARFRTDSSVPRVGFKAMYKLAACGGYIAGQSGAIQSPNYPANYDNNADCEWIVRGPTGHYLTFTFTALRLPYAGTNCTGDKDVLEIREYNATGRLLLSRCGPGVPPPVSTSDSFAYVRFRSNSAIVSTGFRLEFAGSVEECGGDLTTDSGTFNSPNYPGQYAHARQCLWKIRVQQGRRVTLTFDDLSIEGHSRCIFDFVAVYNGILNNSPLIRRYCGEDASPDPVESSGNTMMVRFRTDGSISSRGFRASYTSNEDATCGGLITSGEQMVGNITSPGYPGNYSNNLDCIWVLSNQNQTSTSIVVRFYVFKLEYHGSCYFDFIEIREGNDENGQLIDHYCGNGTAPSAVFTAAPNLWIRFKTDMSIVDQGFLLYYYYSECGGILSEAEGVITSPNYPSFYNHSYNCAWHIMAPEGSRILVQFTNMSLETHPNCGFDFVDILNGGYPTSPSIGKMCGDTVPSQFTSQSNAIRVIFRSDYSINARGFRLTYRFVTGGCGGMFHSNIGHIYSPNYPRSYPHNVECIWSINVQAGYHVVLTFNPPFDLEAHDTCDYDYVEVSDSPYANDSLVPLGRWCKNRTPPPQASSNTRLVVKFRSDQLTNGNGFSANWSTGCGAFYTDDYGFIVSPGYPQDYTNNLLCNYTISVDPQKFIVLEFVRNTFEIEGPASSCMYDSVTVWQGNDTRGRFLGRFCGTVPPQAVSSLGNMFIQFKTDATRVYRGFGAHYRASECGGNFTEPFGVIRTPTHPTMYHHNANCTWFITVQEDRVIDLKFTSFDLEAHSTCAYDYVDIRDGNTLNSSLIGRYCGQVTPGRIRSTGNNMVVNFISDVSVSRGGFSASYRMTYGASQGCGGVLNTTSGRFSSVDGDGNGYYENNLDCRWTIIVGDNQVVKLTFENMEIEEYSCRYDYIKVHDGLSDDDPLVGKYCGSNPPPVIKSTSNVLYVQFVTDGSVVMRGFNASYIQEDALCGGSYIASEEPQTISSPGYPNPVAQNIRCRWTIDAPDSDQNVRVTVSNLNLVNNQQCNSEYLEFRDSPLGSQGRSVHYCGTNVPQPFDSMGQTVQINYAITASSRSQGFSLKYQIGNCNRTFTDWSGQIYSPKWPGNYPVNTNCQILISGPPGTYISLYFNSFSIEPHPQCVYDFLDVRNGSSEDAALINKLCGRMLPDPVFATGNSIWMNFQTDHSITHPGFDITYTATTQGIGCGGNITGINGSLTSPGYPSNYTQSQTCRWLITTPSRRVVTVTFTNMDLIGTENCDRHYVQVFNGNGESSPAFGRYCGREVPAPLLASGNSVLIKFVSDGVGSAPGFRLVFTS